MDVYDNDNDCDTFQEGIAIYLTSHIQDDIDVDGDDDCYGDDCYGDDGYDDKDNCYDEDDDDKDSNDYCGLSSAAWRPRRRRG